MSLKAWIDRDSGAIRVFLEGEALEGFGPETHDLIDCPPELLEGTHDWDPVTRAAVPALAALDAELHGKIDAEAGRFRQTFITTVPGQEMTYLRKESEARAFGADPSGTYPFLSAEAAATGASMVDVAASILAQADAWLAIGSAIEAARLGAKQAVANATSREDKITAAQVDWSALI